MNENELIEGGTAVSQIIEAARARAGVEVIDVTEHVDTADAFGPVPMLALPEAGGGTTTESVLAEVKAWREFRRQRPDRREGTAQLGDFDSFCAHANRFKDPDSAIWISGDPSKPKFTSVLDYHEAVNPPEPEMKALPLAATASTDPDYVHSRVALPRFGKHRGQYVPAFSDEWSLWTGANGKPLGQAAFAALIEKGARDIVDVEDSEDGPNAPLAFAKWFYERFGGKLEIADFYASTRMLLDMSERLVITVEEKVGEVSSRSGGSRALILEGETRSEVVIPSALLLQLPIFRGGDLVQLPARLRVNARQKGDGVRTLEFTVNLYGTDRAIRKEIADMSESVKLRTGLPVFVGEPESA